MLRKHGIIDKILIPGAAAECTGLQQARKRRGHEDVSFVKKLLIALAVYLVLAGIFFLVVRDDWSMTTETSDPVNRDALTQELTGEAEINQTFIPAVDQVKRIILQSSAAGAPAGQIEAAVMDGDKVLFQDTISPETDGSIVLDLSERPVERKGKQLSLILRHSDGISLWYGTTRSAGKISVSSQTDETLTVADELIAGELVMQVTGVSFMPYTRWYWPVTAGVGLILLALILHAHRSKITGRKNLFNQAGEIISRYSYLMKTLVVRDFKVRYKASLLGVLWSFLNPLLMTLVYLFVFSTLFQSSIPHFPVYLMSGIILFNYFSEATNLGMQSIVGNAGLITKVYLPKYAFPISKAISSSINLIISMIPMLIMMLLTGVSFHKSLLLLPLVVIFLIVFSVGVSLILSSVMVFFRDIQFLWGIILTILNFFSPIFYPESIIPAHFLKFYHLNPIYQYLYFMRTIVVGGISPNPITYLYCTLASVITLAVGLLVFKKAQHRFVLYL